MMNKKEVLAVIAGGVAAVLSVILLLVLIALFGSWVLIVFLMLSVAFVGGLVGLSIYEERKLK